MTAHVLQFDDDGLDQLAQVGGKACNLASLTRAGFDVPPGFTVTTAAYSDFLEENGLRATIAATLSTIDWSLPALVEERTHAIRAAIQEAPIPEIIRDRVESAYGVMGSDGYVAVRSSGTAEDLANASFAGLHDSYLDVRGSEAVIAALKRCWASLWTARATSYRHDKDFDRTDTEIQRERNRAPTVTWCPLTRAGRRKSRRCWQPPVLCGTKEAARGWAWEVADAVSDVLLNRSIAMSGVPQRAVWSGCACRRDRHLR
jgi:hypothetical protein